jgi:hypothetical protein
MRLIGVLVLVGLGAFVVTAVGRAAGPTVSADTPVRVETANPVRIILPIDPDEDTITAELIGALKADAREATSRQVRDHLTGLAAEPASLREIAGTVAGQFASGKIAAVAFALYGVDVGDDQVAITAVTAEVVPQYAGIGISIDHENGHALINEEVALACGASIARRLGTAGWRGDVLEDQIRLELWRVGDIAHDHYHVAVSGTPPAQHRPYAANAAERAIAAECS